MPTSVRSVLEQWTSRVGTPNDQVLAFYRQEDRTVVDVLRIEDVELSSDGDVLLHVASPEILDVIVGFDGSGELYEEELEFSRRAILPVNDLLSVRPIRLGIADVDRYREAVDRETRSL